MHDRLYSFQSFIPKTTQTLGGFSSYKNLFTIITILNNVAMSVFGLFSGELYDIIINYWI